MRVRTVCLGNSLMEYGVIGTLLTAACLAVILSTGGQLNDLLLALKTDLLGNIQKAEASAPSGNAAAGASSGGSANPNPDPDLDQLETVIKDALNLGKNIQTSGTNGTTELLADNIKNLADQLKAEGKLTEEEANLLAALANQGYKMARFEEKLAELEASGKWNTGDNFDPPFTIEGETYYSIPQMLLAIGRYDESSGGIEMSKFRDLYETVKTLPIMQNEAISSVVNQSAGDIIEIADSVEDNGWILDPSKGSLNAAVASEFTDKKSDKVCQSGGGQGGQKKCD